MGDIFRAVPIGRCGAEPCRAALLHQPNSLTLKNAESTIRFVRLTDRERNTIVNAVHRYDAHARVYLFGSRVDDAKRGGDIDLLVRSASIGPAERRRIRRSICDVIGEQKIDILVAANLDKPLARVAQRSGVLLQ
jgi:uncharacterized protein